VAAHNDIGKQGEELAAAFLRDQGYHIQARNWRVNRLEIDLVAEQDGMLVFVEVKTRSRSDFGIPAAYVDERKKRLLASAATAYMQAIDHQWAIRFDLISVVLPEVGEPHIEHFPDAFFPGIH
jgi:putative endonuclease